MALSSPGIGSNLDINGIIQQLMSVESQPLVALAKKEASYQAKLSAYGSLKGALTSFQNAVAALNSPSKFQSMSSSTSDASVVKASAGAQAAVGSYNVSVSQLAQAQSLLSSGLSSTSDVIGTGASTTLSFQFGTVTGGTFSSAGSKLSSTVATNGIAANSLSINGTTIVTDGTTTSAKSLATQINLLTGTTGVTATAQATNTGALGTFTTTAGAATYTLDVGGVNIISNAAIGTTAADIDARLIDPTVAANLTAAGITFTGTAAGGTLAFSKADGSNIAIQESGAGATGGFGSTVGAGTTKTFTSSVSLSSGNAINIGGTSPLSAGFATGIAPNNYSGATFTQDSNQAIGTVTIDSSNNTMQGIRDAINKAGVGVTATIISSNGTNRLVLTSNKTGETSSMKISVSGDATISGLLAYDPAGTQNLTQTTIGQNALLSVNGVAVQNASNTITGAIQDVSLTVSKVGSSTVGVSRDTASVTSSVNGFVKAFNDMNKTLKDLTAYNADTKVGGPLLGDATVRNVQAGLRQTISMSIPELTGNLKTLSDVGVSFQKDGTLAVDSTKLQKAIADNFSEMGSLFAAMGTATDSLVSYASSTDVTKAGKYDVNITKIASHGKLAGSQAPNLTITNGVNSNLSVTIDGVTASVDLLAGTYTASALASHLQSAINGISAFSSAGISVKVTADGSNFLTVESNKFGSTSAVSISGAGATDLMGAAPVSTAGEDVAGTIGGFTATGAGQFLTGSAGSAVEGLKLQITGSTTGSRGTLTFTRGYAYHLQNLVEGYVDSAGIVSGRTDGINASIKDIGHQRDAINNRLADTEKRLRAQFTALDVALSNMSRTSTYLQQQLSNLPKIS
ncbi:flagellar filament capping protein FliD [Noviherbaspirillum sp.]|uniref:flagellar filament capping protein FliD n=1 Tax=Noviherbaspirillum sp. TaxID=1926288 RepID=UPI0025D52B62|nr:flagellar filament capping protein FliD [Noviherbaspirillum sp.]